MPSCTRCLRDPRRRKCVVSCDSDRCAECIRAGGNVTCDVWGPSKGIWEKVERAEKTLSEDSKSLRAEQHELLERLTALSAKIARVDKQREMFRAKAADMLRRGLRSLDELEAAEEAERVEAEKGAAVETPRPTPFVLSDPELDPSLVAALSDFDPLDPIWEGLDFGGGTPVATQGIH